MSWTNVGLIVTTEDWQYTQEFVGDYVRITHLLGVSQDDLPYGFTGLIAQAFDFLNTPELYRIRKLYPFNSEDIIAVVNPFPDRPRRLAVRGPRRYQTGINWRVSIDAWDIEAPINTVELVPRIDAIELKIDLILTALNIEPEPPPTTATAAQQAFFFLQ